MRLPRYFLATLFLVGFIGSVAQAQQMLQPEFELTMTATGDMERVFHITRSANKADCSNLADFRVTNAFGDDVISIQRITIEPEFEEESVTLSVTAPGDFVVGSSVGSLCDGEYYFAEQVEVIRIDPDGELENYEDPQAEDFDMEIPVNTSACADFAIDGHAVPSVGTPRYWHYEGFRGSSDWKNQVTGSRICVEPPKDWVGHDTLRWFIGNGREIAAASILIEVVPSVGIEDAPQQESYFSIYPNPARAEFALELSSRIAGVAQVEVYDLRGRRVMSKEKFLSVGTNSVSMEVDDLSSGFYLLRMTSSEGVRSKTVSIVR